jgi:N-acetylmuramoyl-L-alanine amidase
MVIRVIAFIMLVLFIAYGCSKSRYSATNRIYKRQAKVLAKTIRERPSSFSTIDATGTEWVGTTNFNLRKPNFVILHHTAQKSCDQTLKTFTLPRTEVSAHYIVCKDGTIHHMLNDYLRAWHAGIARWGNVTDINSASIGIEIDNNGFEVFTEVQLNSLLKLLDTLKRKYNIPQANFIGHADIAPVRKNDPNIYFPWQGLAQKGFGIWFGDTTDVVVPDSFNYLQALRVIGYDVRDSVAAVRAFKRHFVADTVTVVTDADKKIMVDLMKKCM